MQGNSTTPSPSRPHFRVADRKRSLETFQEAILARKGLIACGDGFSIALHESDRPLFVGADRYGQSAVRDRTDIAAVTALHDRILLMDRRGRTRILGGTPDEQAYAASLISVRRAAQGRVHMAVLIGNGRVLVGGKRHPDMELVSEWSHIADIACGADFTAALTRDGRVLLAGGSRAMQQKVKALHDIVGIDSDVDANVLYALTVDGKIFSTGKLPRRAREWKNIVHLSAMGGRLCAVDATGRLYADFPLPPTMTAPPADGEAFVACAVGRDHMLALTRDGRVLAHGDDRYGQCRTAAFGTLFAQYDEFIIRRRERADEPDRMERISRIRATEAQRFAKYLACSERLTACITAYGRALTSPGFGECKLWTNIHRIACGNAHILALCKDGTVRADGNDIGIGSAGGNCCDVSEWKGVRAVAAGSYHSLGVTYDGHVYFCGSNEHGQGDVAEWNGIRAVYTTDTYTVGLQYNGHLLIAGLPPFDQLLLGNIRHRVADVKATPTHVLCLLEDGHAVATLPPDLETGRTEMDRRVLSWGPVCAIAADRDISVGLCYGGTVRVAGGSPAIAETVASWQDIVAIGCGSGYVAGLGADGHIHIAGEPRLLNICHTESASAHAPADTPSRTPFAESIYWQDIIAFVCGPSHLVALNRDGQVLACGSDSDGQCSVTTHFMLFRDARALPGYGPLRHAEKSEVSADPSDA